MPPSPGWFAPLTVRCLPRAGGRDVTTCHFPAALRKASLILSCQPGPPSWKNSRTSWSMRKGTSSFAKGIFGAVGTVSTGFLVTDLNAASAASFALSPRWRFRGGIIIFVPCDVRAIRRRGKPLCFAEMSSQDEHFNVPANSMRARHELTSRALRSRSQRLAQGGVKVTILSGEQKAVITKYRARQHQMLLLCWGPNYMDLHTNTDSFARKSG